MEENIVEVDGSHGEGGGQIIRNAVSYTCLLRRKLRVKNIRAGRPKPGLASQHLESILAIMRISQASSPSLLQIGSTEFELDGSGTSAGSDGVYTTVDLKTAGSVSLCIQCVLPYLLARRTPSQVKIIGGTHVMKSPNFDYLQRIFMPVMNRFLGYNVKVTMDRAGYYPRGGGIVHLYINRENDTDFTFKHFRMVDRGRLLQTQAILNVPPKLSNRSREFCTEISEVTRDIETRTVPYASVEYFLKFENAWVSFYYLSPNRHPKAEDVRVGIGEVNQKMKEFLGSSAVVDEFMQDQLILYMAMAKVENPGGSSEILTEKLTDHTTSAIHVSHLFMPSNVRFNITPLEDGKTFSISI